MKFSIEDFFSKCDQSRAEEAADLVTFTEKILNEKLQFLCSVKTTGNRILIRDHPNLTIVIS